MSYARSLFVVSVAVGTVACTALLGDFAVSGGAGPAAAGDGGDGGGEGGAVAVTITPAEIKVGILRPFAFVAAGGDVTWSVQEGAPGGTVDPSGRYASPDKPGVYHVVATSKLDPTKSATATVTVVPLGVDVLAGQVGGPGNIDGPLERAHFRGPRAMAISNAGVQVTYISDTGNSTIRRWSGGNAVTTLAGNPALQGTADGVGAAALFRNPSDMVLNEGDGKLYVLDQGNYCIRKVDPATGAATTLSGTCGTNAHKDSPPDAAPNGATFENLDAMVLSTYRDALYVCEIGNTFRGVRRVDIATGRATSILTGLNNSCRMTSDFYRHEVYLNDNDNAASIRKFTDVASLTSPTLTQLAVLPSGGYSTRGMVAETGYGNSDDVYVLASQDPAIWRYSIRNNVWDSAPYAGASGTAAQRFEDGPLATARLSRPYGLFPHPQQGDLFVFDGNAVRKLDTYQQTLKTVLGLAPNDAPIDGARATQRFTHPIAVASDDAGNLYVADMGFEAQNNTIRKFDPKTATLSTLAGVVWRATPADPLRDGPHDVAKFGITWDLVRVGADLYVLDVFGHAIRKVSMTTGEVRTVAGELGVSGKSDGVGATAHFTFYGNGSASSLGGALATDGTDLYVTDSGNFAVRKMTLATGAVTTLAGGTKGSANGVGAAAQFQAPLGLAYADGFLYVSDVVDATIRRVDVKTREVTSFLGLVGQQGTQDGDAATATFNAPFRLAVDGIGNMYVSELALDSDRTGTGLMRRVDMKARRVSTFAGTRDRLGVGRGPLPSTLNCPAGLFVRPGGDLLFADLCDGVVGVVQPL